VHLGQRCGWRLLVRLEEGIVGAKSFACIRDTDVDAAAARERMSRPTSNEASCRD
jgi:hypothetical protein